MQLPPPARPAHASCRPRVGRGAGGREGAMRRRCSARSTRHCHERKTCLGGGGEGRPVGGGAVQLLLVHAKRHPSSRVSIDRADQAPTVSSIRIRTQSGQLLLAGTGLTFPAPQRAPPASALDAPPVGAPHGITRSHVSVPTGRGPTRSGHSRVEEASNHGPVCHSPPQAKAVCTSGSAHTSRL